VFKSKLIQYNIPASNIPKLLSFYATIAGDLEFARSLTALVTSYHLPISKDGLQLTITQRHSAQEPPIAYFAVENLDETIEAALAEGGSVLVEPFQLPIAPHVLAKYKEEFSKHHDEASSDSVGRAAVLRDPEGNLFGLTELHEQAHSLFKVGKYYEELDDAQLAQHDRGIALGKKLQARK